MLAIWYSDILQVWGEGSDFSDIGIFYVHLMLMKKQHHFGFGDNFASGVCFDWNFSSQRLCKTALVYSETHLAQICFEWERWTDCDRGNRFWHI